MTRVVIIGGFLGAGKTTLMLATARRLSAQGQRVGLITNDQAADMVDTRLVRLASFSVAEISGGCICCRFGDFADEIRRMLRDIQPDVLLVEPVGSCVDLAATVMRPLRRYVPDVSIGPLTALADPAAWLRITDGRSLPRETAYIYSKQLAEADIILVNKRDITSGPMMNVVREQIQARVPRARILSISARTGAGLRQWWNEVLSSEGARQDIDVNYDTYAKGEACLGWLNAIVELEAGGEPRWKRILPEFTREMCNGLGKAGAAPAHLKCLLTSGKLVAAANATLGSPAPSVRVLAAGKSRPTAELVVNVRTALPPRYLRSTLTVALESLRDTEGKILSECSFAPARPTPQHRIRALATQPVRRAENDRGH